jgi:hypothetical protein
MMLLVILLLGLRRCFGRKDREQTSGSHKTKGSHGTTSLPHRT